VVDQQVPGNGHQPCTDCGSLRIEAISGAPGPLKGLLGKVLGVGTRAYPVGEEAVNAIEMIVVCLFKVQNVDASEAEGSCSQMAS
jgi:hypothetical protein